jgi:hypothetical protein
MTTAKGLSLTDSKLLIITDGKNVYSAEMTNSLAKHPAQLSGVVDLVLWVLRGAPHNQGKQGWVGEPQARPRI